MAVGRRLKSSGDLDAVLLGPALDDADDAVHLCGQRMGMWDSKPVGAANPTAESELAGAGEGGDGTGGVGGGPESKIRRPGRGPSIPWL